MIDSEKEVPKNNTNLIKKKLLSAVLATSAIWIGLIACGLYVEENSNISIPSLNINTQKVEVLKVARNIKVGDEIKSTDLKISKESVDKVVSVACNNPSQIIGKVADRNLYQNQQILADDVISKSLVENKLRLCTVPITLSNLNDNTISAGDYIDLLAVYKKENKKPEVVSSKVLVKSVVDSKGQPIRDSQDKTSTDTQIPAYITVLAPSEDISNIEDAKKTRTIDCFVYSDKNAQASEKTYVPSWNQAEAQK